jgi:hypothetical protein
MKRFTFLAVLVLLMVVLSGCSLFQNKEQAAFGICLSQAVEERGEMTVEQLVSYLDSTEREEWSLECQRWAKIVDIGQTESILATQQSDLESIESQIEARDKAEENAQQSAAQTATALAQPTFTSTPPSLSLTPPPTATQVP